MHMIHVRIICVHAYDRSGLVPESYSLLLDRGSVVVRVLLRQPDVGGAVEFCLLCIAFCLGGWLSS